jgi:hypothetical protein
MVMTELRPVGPGASCEELADAVGALAGAPELAAHSGTLRGLSRVLRDPRSSDADSWFQLDLLATIARPDSLRPVPPIRTGWRRPLSAKGLSIASSGLIFFPVLCTWFGISAAAAAYGAMLSSRAGRSAAAGQSFIELWQSGFGGRLPSLLDLTHVAVYALVAIVALITVTLAGATAAQADESTIQKRRTELEDRLAAALTGAQLELNRRRLDSPGRFAAELSMAAGRLGKILTQARHLEETADSTASNAAASADRSAEAADHLGTSADVLGQATRDLQAISGKLEGAVGALQTTVSQLGEDITGKVGAAAQGLTAAAEAAQVAASATYTSGQTALADTGWQLERTLADVAEQVWRATNGLTAAGEGFIARLGVTGDQAASHIGVAYEEAVLAVAGDLEAKMTHVGDQLAAAVHEVATASVALVGTAERIEAATRTANVSASQATSAAETTLRALNERAGGLSEAMLAAASRLGDAAAEISRRPGSTPLEKETAVWPVSGPVQAPALDEPDEPESSNSNEWWNT